MEDTAQEEQEVHQAPLIPASLGKRLGNWLIDMFLGAIIIELLLAIVSAFYPPLLQGFLKNPYAFKNTITMQFCYAVLLSLQEGFLGGKTIGKYLTRTRAVRIDGSRLPTETAFLRSLIRIIPFEPFTILFLGRPLHDIWSSTTVIDESQRP